MDKENMSTVTPEPDEDTMLPEGYENGNIFDEPAGDRENLFGEEDKLEGFGDEDEGKGESAPEGQPETQEPEKEDGVSEDDPPAAAQEQVAEGSSKSFTFKNGETDITVKEDDLPGIYQRAQEHAGLTGEISKLRAELESVNANAKAMGFESAQQMMAKAAENYRENEIKRLVDGGTSEEVARFMVESRMKEAKPQSVQQAPSTPARDFRREIDELVQHRPELRETLAGGGKLPQEVVTACVKDGVPLRTAYAEYEIREVRAEAERVRRENEILKQNEKNAARAPVKSATSGGSESPKGKDPFLMGFESDN